MSFKVGDRVIYTITRGQIEYGDTGTITEIDEDDGEIIVDVDGKPGGWYANANIIQKIPITLIPGPTGNIIYANDEFVTKDDFTYYLPPGWYHVDCGNHSYSTTITKERCCNNPQIITNSAAGEIFKVCKTCKCEVDSKGFKV